MTNEETKLLEKMVKALENNEDDSVFTVDKSLPPNIMVFTDEHGTQLQIETDLSGEELKIINVAILPPWNKASFRDKEKCQP